MMFRGRTGLSVRRRSAAEPALKFKVLFVGFQDLDRQTDMLLFFFFSRQSVEVLKFEVLSVGFQDFDRQTDMVFFSCPFPAGCPGLIPGFFFPALFRQAALG
jgi:hypothetical protein